MADTITYPVERKKVYKKAFLATAKIFLIIGLIWILYYQLFAREDLSLEDLYDLFYRNISLQKLPLLVIVIFLMPLNWLFETRKWLSLMANFQEIPFNRAIRAIMAGVTFSLFTPNRLGEHGGRILLVEPGKRHLAALATVVGAVSQWIVLIVGGWWAMVLGFGVDIFPISNVAWYTVVVLGLTLTSTLFFLYYRLQLLSKLLPKFIWTRKWVAKLGEIGFENYSTTELNKALWYSLVRYATYSFQYLLLLYFFGFESSTLEIVLAILIVYLLQTGIPLPPSTGLLARGSIALFIFGFLAVIETNATAVLAATFGLWIINVVLPALLGAYFVTKLGWTKGSEAASTTQTEA